MTSLARRSSRKSSEMGISMIKCLPIAILFCTYFLTVVAIENANDEKSFDINRNRPSAQTLSRRIEEALSRVNLPGAKIRVKRHGGHGNFKEMLKLKKIQKLKGKIQKQKFKLKQLRKKNKKHKFSSSSSSSSSHLPKKHHGSSSSSSSGGLGQSMLPFPFPDPFMGMGMGGGSFMGGGVSSSSGGGGGPSMFSASIPMQQPQQQQQQLPVPPPTTPPPPQPSYGYQNDQQYNSDPKSVFYDKFPYLKPPPLPQRKPYKSVTKENYFYEDHYEPHHYPEEHRSSEEDYQQRSESGESREQQAAVQPPLAPAYAAPSQAFTAPASFQAAPEPLPLQRPKNKKPHKYYRRQKSRRPFSFGRKKKPGKRFRKYRHHQPVSFHRVKYPARRPQPYYSKPRRPHRYQGRNKYQQYPPYDSGSSSKEVYKKKSSEEVYQKPKEVLKKPEPSPEPEKEEPEEEEEPEAKPAEEPKEEEEPEEEEPKVEEKPEEPKPQPYNGWTPMIMVPVSYNLPQYTKSSESSEEKPKASHAKSSGEKPKETYAKSSEEKPTYKKKYRGPSVYVFEQRGHGGIPYGQHFPDIKLHSSGEQWGGYQLPKTVYSGAVHGQKAYSKASSESGESQTQSYTKPTSHSGEKVTVKQTYIPTSDSGESHKVHQTYSSPTHSSGEKLGGYQVSQPYFSGGHKVQISHASDSGEKQLAYNPHNFGPYSSSISHQSHGSTFAGYTRAPKVTQFWPPWAQAAHEEKDWAKKLGHSGEVQWNGGSTHLASPVTYTQPSHYFGPEPRQRSKIAYKAVSSEQPGQKLEQNEAEDPEEPDETEKQENATEPNDPEENTVDAEDAENVTEEPDKNNEEPEKEKDEPEEEKTVFIEPIFYTQVVRAQKSRKYGKTESKESEGSLKFPSVDQKFKYEGRITGPVHNSGEETVVWPPYAGK